MNTYVYKRNDPRVEFFEPKPRPRYILGQKIFQSEALFLSPSSKSILCVDFNSTTSSFLLGMASPLIAGAAVAGAAWASRFLVLSWRNFMARQGGAAATRFPRALAGGFEEEMTRREAFQILGLREGSSKDQIREAHRRLMRLNHPDNGGSTFVATKVNEAKDFLLSGRRGARII